MNEPTFEIGEFVYKHTGDGRYWCEVRGVFAKRCGAVRYAVEIEAAGGGTFCHIYGGRNLTRTPPSDAPPKPIRGESHTEQGMNDQDICPLPSPTRTVRISLHTELAYCTVEPGDEVAVLNESGVKIEVEAGTLAHGRTQRINELIAERDALVRSAADVLAQPPGPEKGEAAVEFLELLVAKHHGSEVGDEANEPQRPCKLDDQARRLKLLKRIAGLERELADARQAIRDAIRSPMGLVPASAERFVRESEVGE